MVGFFNLSDKKLVDTVHQWFQDDKRHLAKMRRQMREDYDFYAGDQWESQDEAFLKENRRPIVTFNRTAPTIDSVSGSERANRQEVRYLPRTLDDGEVAEMYTETSRWVRDKTDAEDEESEAFEDAIKVGLGCTETWVDFETELDGEIRISRVPPLELLWDSAAIQRNLADAKRVYRVKMLPKSEIRQLWPDKRLKIGDKNFKLEERPDVHDSTPELAYRQGLIETGRNEKNELPVVQVQWWERRPVWRVLNPNSGQIEVLTGSEYEAIQEQLGELPAVRQSRKEYFQAFIVGDTLLDKRPLHESNTIIPGFTLKFITGKRDEINGMWFGLMRAMRDPQKWSNKFFSQILDIVNSNAKGGILAESDAFQNPRKAEEDWAKPDAIIWTNPGALQNKKIEDRQTAPFPTAIANLMQIAMGAVRDTSGVSIEQLGLAQRTQSGVVEQSRIRQGLVTLTIFFDSMRRYRKEQGRLLLHMIDLYVPDQTMVRVIGEDKFVKFEKNGEIPRFDIIVDQSPTSPDQKQEIWIGLQQILPAMIRAGMPVPPDLLEYAPLPASAVSKIRKFMAEQAQASAQAQQRQQQIAEADAQAEIQGKNAKAMEDIASAIGQLQARQNDANKTQVDLLKVVLENLEDESGSSAGSSAGNSGS